MSDHREQATEALSSGRAAVLLQWVLADIETPVSAYAKLRSQGACALLESVEGGERWGRYSIIALKPRRTLRLDRRGYVSLDGGPYRDEGPPLDVLKRYFAELDVATPELPGLPRFLGGWLGYLGYGAVHWIEPAVPDTLPERLALPEALFYEVDLAVLFDNVRHTLAVVHVVRPDPERTPEAIVAAGEARMAQVVEALMQPLVLPLLPADVPAEDVDLQPLQSRASFEQAVRTAVAAILAGDVIQVVLSQRFEADCDCDALTLYRALRLVNPSPYLFFLEMDEGAFVGSSPEVLVRLEGRRATLRPIAGTRRRGATAEADAALERDLLDDPKEIAEHVMLVDLGRNDLGRVSKPGSVCVSERMVIERYSHVMHIVSNIESELADGLDAVDLIKATFPAGTVSGAPKVRAMQLIDELEQVRRGPYSGAVGYVTYGGDLDTGIMIRTMFMVGGKLIVQAGAGIVADSDPAAEYEETLNKAGALFAAARLARRGLRLDA